ncbi:MAG TPA: AarF/ABC1/UbiB kinase family protein [Clostridiales bacterium]|nr:AarF/ABC1/UbiB kinase family protein [Clostridiales bacterium]HQP70474.1 AarF/ABC1/UbiB kinase family protein [Clostridiales bacterium]
MLEKINSMNKIYRHTNRYVEIIEVIGTHGFAEIIKRSKLPGNIRLRRIHFLPSINSDIYKFTYSERIRMILGKLGPTFIKFGQILSSRPDIFPAELIIELEKLQDSVPPFSEDKALAIVEKELNKPVRGLFKDFDLTPLASASISQVHKAILFSGEEVVVKIQKPDIAKIIEIDLEIMLFIANTIDKYVSELKPYNLPGIVREFEKAIWKELDFTIEASNMERFKTIFLNSNEIHIPKCYRKLSTSKILTIEFIDGIKVSEIDKLNKNNVSLKTIASNGIDAILKQIFEDGYFHADLHPGNIMVLPGNVISFIDFGIVGKFSKRSQELLVSGLIAISDRNIERTAKTILEFSEGGKDIDSDNFELQVEEIFDKHFVSKLEKLDLIEIFKDVHKLFSVNRLVMPENFYLLLKTLAMAQSFGLKLDPDLNIIEHMKPFAKKFINRNMNLEYKAKEIYGLSNDIWDLVKVLPYESTEILKILKKGKIKIEIQHTGFENMLTTHERLSNRLAYSLVLASLVIGSALVIQSGIPPFWNGMPIIGLAGFVSAVFLGFWLLISIMKHGKM